MIRFLSVILYLPHARAVVEYLHKALAYAPKGALLVIADAPYGKTSDETGFEGLAGNGWKLVATTHFKRKREKCIDNVMKKEFADLTTDDWNLVATHFKRGRGTDNIIEQGLENLTSINWNSVTTTYFKREQGTRVDNVMKLVWPESFEVTDLGKSSLPL
jgi:hypothetical protein